MICVYGGSYLFLLYIIIGIFLFVIIEYIYKKKAFYSNRYTNIEKNIVSSDCKFIIIFDKGFNKYNISNENIYILDEKHSLIPIKVQIKDSYTLIITAQSQGYLAGKTYNLYLNDCLDLKSSNNKEYRVDFKISPN